MKTTSLTALLLASALTLAGCNRAAPANNAGDAAPKPEATNTPAPAPAANESEAEGEGGGPPTATVGTARQNFSVVNATGHVVATLNVSPTSESSWGPDILGRDVLEPGQTASRIDRLDPAAKRTLSAAAVIGSRFDPGLLETLGAGYVSSTYKDGFAFVMILVVLFAMPQGLLGRRAVNRV